MHWFLVYTKPRQEKCALENLCRQGYECYLPTLPLEKIRQGMFTFEDEPLFPRYLFIRLGLGNSAKGWGPIRYTTGVSRLVSFGSEPARIDDCLIAQLQTSESSFKQRPARLFEAGDRVHFADGPFTGIEGIFQIAEGEKRVLVLIEMMSKPLSVGVAPSMLRKIG
jgi:transcriptional antiterminator RfaH